MNFTRLLVMAGVKFFVLLLLPLWADYPREVRPFWSEARNQGRLQKNEILVSVINRQGRTEMKGAGWVKASLEQSFQFAQDYSQLQKLKLVFSEVSYRTEQREILFRLRVLKHEEKLRIRVTPGGQGPERLIEFEVIEGLGQGSKGLLLLEDLKRQPPLIQVSFQAATPNGQKFSWLMNVGIEALLRTVASSLRSSLEQKALTNQVIGSDL